MKKFKLVTTWKISNRMSEQFDLTYYKLNKDNFMQYLTKLIKLIFLAAKSDVFLIPLPDWDSLVVGFLAKIISREKTKIVVYEIILQKPNSIKTYLKAYFQTVLLWGVDKFICHHKDTSGYEKYYKINKDKFCYVPFKANNYNMLSSIEVKDGDYILACGASCRDYDTFVKSIMNLGYSTKIVLPEENVAKFHHTALKFKESASNIEVVRHDFNIESWNEYIAKARVVVIPIKKGTIQSAGISVLLEALALGKPVVITEGEATRGIITPDVAMIVPPEDIIMMTRAIQKIWCDDEFRIVLSKNAKDFALKFGDTDRMMNDIFHAIHSFLITDKNL